MVTHRVVTSAAGCRRIEALHCSEAPAMNSILGGMNPISKENNPNPSWRRLSSTFRSLINATPTRLQSLTGYSPAGWMRNRGTLNSISDSGHLSGLLVRCRWPLAQREHGNQVPLGYRARGSVSSIRAPERLNPAERHRTDKHGCQG